MFIMNIALWCFSFVTLFNLQGTRPVRLSGGTCSILPRRSAFVKHFFQLFWSSFGACRSFPPLSQTAYLFYQSCLSLSSTFLTSFEVFSLSTRAFSPFFRQLSYFTRASWICQVLFYFVENLFCSRRWHDRRVSDSLLTIPDLPPFVNSLFTKFLRKLQKLPI